MKLSDDPEEVGKLVRQCLKFGFAEQRAASSWEAAIGKLRSAMETAGVTAVINGVVGNNTHRKLDSAAFLGFALHDEYAPLIFVNGSVGKSCQMFTLVHEFAHLWLGEQAQGLSGYDNLQPGEDRVEKFCDQAVANFLVPAQSLRTHWQGSDSIPRQCKRLSRDYKVSPIVIARRAKDLGLIGWDEYIKFYRGYASDENYRTV